MMNKNDAINLALKRRPGMKVANIRELDNCFVVNLIPKNSYKDINYMGGATRVDKKTGKVSLYNPMMENVRQ